MTKSTPQLYRPRRHPYYVAAPDYIRTSAGIRVMHHLCDALNQLGEEAYVTTRRTNPGLNTPTLSEEIRANHLEAGLRPIAIYPEITGANPLECELVVRYILNQPGLLGEKPNYEESDLIYVYVEELKRHFGKVCDVMTLPSVDNSLFNNLDNPLDNEREGACIYFGRYEEGRRTHADLASRCTEITKAFPSTHAELVALFRRSRVLYCFENTSLSLEANLCGCPTVLFPSPFVDRDHAFTTSRGLFAGTALDDNASTLELARAKLPEVAKRYAAVERDFWRVLGRLVALTQQQARALPAFNGITPVHRKSPGSDVYPLWRARRTPQEIDGQIHAERMLNAWRFRPRFTFSIVLESPEAFPLLADTVDSLARQWYPEWQLIVFAANQPEPPEVAEIPHIVWISDPTIAPSFTNALGVADGDFVCRVPIGTTLEDHALQLISDHINRASGWLAFYLDHDEQDVAGNVTPRFKPDFNADLLYAQNYIGPVAFVCREAIQAFNGANEAGAVEPYGLLVRLFEQASAATIGHIADPLIHLPGRPAADLAYEQTVLDQHFARTKRSAHIEAGWFEGTRRIRFEKADDCLLSVIVMSHCLPGYLRCSLESLREHGGHESLEVIVVAHRVSDPDLQHLLDDYAAGAIGIPVTVRHEDCDFAPAAFRNRASAEARGDYLLFLDDDTEFFQPDSLAHLVSYARANALAAAAPRLVSANDGNPRIVGSAAILGFQSLAGSIAPADASVLDTTRELRLQLDQEVSALPSNCLLVDKKWFDRLGGFDEQAAPRLLHDLDFCIRARKAGARLAWLPSIDVIHHQGQTLREIAADPMERERWCGIQEREREAMLERHLPFLALDPAYNRNLSLIKPFVPDIEVVSEWDTVFHDRPRLVGVPLTTGAGQYRVVAPFKALSRAGLAQCTIVHPIGNNMLRALTSTEVARLAPDTLVYQNCIDDAMIRQLAESQRWNAGVFHICTIDDRLGDLPRDNPLYASHTRQGRTRLRKALSHCDRLIVSTKPLREYCADLIEDIHVVPNRLERDVWTGLKVAVNEGKRPRVGWVGAMQHGGDLRLIEPVVRELATEVDWVFMGMCPDFLKPYVRETHDFVSIRDYPAKMASLALDLALAPLEIHPFNECKSNLRLLEYGALGWPVICTDIDPYRTDSPPVTRLPNTPSDWIAAIRERLTDRTALRAEGAVLQEWVFARYMLDDGLDTWLNAFLRNPAKGP